MGAGIGFALKALPVLVVALLLVQYFREPVVIVPFSVPRVLSDQGVTDAVAAEELRQRIYAVYQRATLNDRAGSGIALAPEIPDITVPTTGVSVNTIFDAISAVLPWKTRSTISGAFTGDGGNLRLTVLVDGRRVYPTGADPPATGADALLDGAADAVVENTKPLSRAFDLLERRQPDRADRFLTTMIDRSAVNGGDLAVAYQLRGIILYDEHRLADACTEFVRSLQIAPNRGETHRNLSILLASEGRPDQATAEAQEAVLVSWGRDSWAYYELGNRYYERQHWSDADAAYARSIELWYENPYPHDALGQTRRQERDDAGALRQYDVAIALAGAFANAYVHRGELFAQTRRLADAKADFVAALRLDPSLAEADDGLGEVDYAQGRSDLARAAFRNALRANVSDAYAYAGLHQALRDAAYGKPARRRAVDAAFSATTVCRSGRANDGPIAADPSLKDVVALTCAQSAVATRARGAGTPVCQADPPDGSPLHVASTMAEVPNATMFYSLAFAGAAWRHAGWLLLAILGIGALLLTWQRLRSAGPPGTRSS